MLFQQIHHAQALLIVRKALRTQIVEGELPGMTEGRMSQVMPHGDGFRQILVEPQRPGDDPRDLSDLQRMGQAGAVVVAFRSQEDLRLVL